ADGTVHAHFRFQGSTCSNGGIPLELLFNIHVGPRDEGRRILSAACAPAPGDTGCAQMCQASADPPGFFEQFGRFSQFVDRPLSEVAAWNPEINPAGCVCTEQNRNHKWKIALATVRYALDQEGASK